MCHRVALALSLVLLTPSLTAIGAELVIAPYLQAMRSDGVVVLWETDAPATGRVRYGVGAETDLMSDESPAGTHHEVTLDGLAPGATHTYQIEIDGQSVGEPASFVTFPAGPEPTLDLLVCGDNRSDHESHAEIITAMLQHPADLVVNTGDMVASGEQEDQWVTFFSVEAELLKSTPMFPVIGNHDERDGQLPDVVARLLEPPKNGNELGTYYSWDVGNSHFIVVEAHVAIGMPWNCAIDIMAMEVCFSDEQVDWLMADLAAARDNPDVEHVFVFSHIGPYSSKEGRTGLAHLRWLLPELAQSKVKLIMSGHDHYYEHGRAANGIHYVITGGGGAPLYETTPGYNTAVYHNEVWVSTAVHNFIRVSVDGPHVRVDAYEADGTLLEAFSVLPRPSCEAAADCEGQEAGPCEGSWSCGGDGLCYWDCVPDKDCVLPVHCGDPPEGACPGEWDCDHGACSWICAPAPDCVVDADCETRAPLEDCEGGSYACVDGMCEWRCTEPDCVEDADCEALVTPTDCEGGHAACEQGDCAWVCPDPPVEVVEPEPEPEPVPEVQEPAPDASADQGSTEPAAEPEEGDGGGSSCAVGGPARPGVVWLLGVLLAFAFVRRRRAVRVGASEGDG